MHVNALKDSPLVLLPEDKYPYLLTFLDPRSLARLAIVCRLFKRVSEDDRLWKRLYENKWSVPQLVGAPIPRQWKNYYERRDGLSRENAHPGQAMLWSRGLPFTAVLQGEPQALWWAAFHPVLGIPPQVHENKNGQSTLNQVLADILTRYSPNPQDALALFLQYRSEWIKRAPVIGAWLSMLFHANKTVAIIKEQKIFFPTHLHKPEEHRWFLQGTAIAWLERGRHMEALITLQCLAQMRLREAGQGGNVREYDRFFAAIVIQGTREKSTALSERMADILAEMPSQVCLALDIYYKTFHSAVCPSIQTEMRFAEKICRALISARKHDLKISEQVLAIPLTVFQKYVTSTKELFTPDTLTAFFEMATLYEFRPFYGPLIRESKLEAYQNSTTPEAGCFYSAKMKLCEKAEDIPEAVHAWVMLCKCLSCHPEKLTEEREGIFQSIYRLIDENPAAGAIVRNLKTDSKLAQVAIAYAMYKNGEVDSALQTMIALISFVRRDDLNWVQICSRTCIQAVLIYSLALDSEAELDEYYMDMLDYHPKMAGLIYHNLATRLCFEGCYDAALKIIQLAEQESFNEPEMWAVKGLYYLSCKVFHRAQECFEAAYKLDPAFHLDRSYDRQFDLLIFEVEQSEEGVTRRS
ncbi:MAG: F-box protein [Parachlamydia sp.]|nr:F-box protein [Parachlamydia sp.]